MVVSPGRCNPSALCLDCAVECWPWEMFIVTDRVWAETGAGLGVLCVGCLEDRLDRVLGPDDFPPVSLNDDHATDSVRLRTRKGSGRRTEELYRLAVDAVLDLGADAAATAATLQLDAGVLPLMVDQAQFGRAALAEIDA
jgi:hypothetical protein